MIDKLYIKSYENEQPSEYADRLGIIYTKQVSVKHKKDNGQFFTPTPIAKLMASFCDNYKSSIRILDPGCGTAILSCALIEEIVKKNKEIKLITLEVYETDSEIIPFTEESLSYLKEWLLIREINFQYLLHIHDFILGNASVLNTNSELELFESNSIVSNFYDIIISNPPYFKLSKDDRRAIVAHKLISGQPNIYSLFMGIASKLLSENGELVFITPRSFASGSYFKAFRELFFNTVQIDKIHLFNSRKDTFNRDSVLQETVVIKAIKEAINPNKKVIVSSSSGLKDIFKPAIKILPCSELIDLNSKEKILHLPINDKEDSILKLVTKWEDNLIDYDIQISTGPVVSFRALDFILDNYDKEKFDLAPLFWLHNVNKMYLEWPLSYKDKGQFIKIEDGSKSILLPNKNYVFLRRFSTKDDKSRLIAAPYFCNYLQGKYIGVENKVNYIYRKKGHLERSEIAGLCALLNSEIFDTYFQIFNGNVNVSATELREMRFPPLLILKEIGNEIILSNDYSMENVNQIVNSFFELETILN